MRRSDGCQNASAAVKMSLFELNLVKSTSTACFNLILALVLSEPVLILVLLMEVEDFCEATSALIWALISPDRSTAITCPPAGALFARGMGMVPSDMHCVVRVTFLDRAVKACASHRNCFLRPFRCCPSSSLVEPGSGVPVTRKMLLANSGRHEGRCLEMYT